MLVFTLATLAWSLLGSPGVSGGPTGLAGSQDGCPSFPGVVISRSAVCCSPGASLLAGGFLSWPLCQLFPGVARYGPKAPCCLGSIPGCCLGITQCSCRLYTISQLHPVSTFVTQTHARACACTHIQTLTHTQVLTTKLHFSIGRFLRLYVFAAVASSPISDVFDIPFAIGLLSSLFSLSPSLPSLTQSPLLSFLFLFPVPLSSHSSKLRVLLNEFCHHFFFYISDSR